MAKTKDDDRIYGGSEQYVHVPDGQRQALGEKIAGIIDREMRAISDDRDPAKPLCPGCYMVVLYNAALTLAERNKQSKKELCASMALVFTKLAKEQQMSREEILVCLDEAKDQVIWDGAVDLDMSMLDPFLDMLKRRTGNPLQRDEEVAS